MKGCISAYLVSLLGSALLLVQVPPSSLAFGYFESQYNPVPNTGGPNQLKMLGTWGYFTETGGLPNNYHPAVGDEVGAFWNNGTDDILVGTATINSGMAADRAYGTLDIFGRDTDYPEGL
ncbi:MAG: hypothetical protein P9M08_08770, partial [Candidatus Erginobacter occultus]|nr:hypothetical protein [Candidatus Erginobacter occultus]